MVAAPDARKRIVKRVQQTGLVFVYRTEVARGAKNKIASKGLKEAQSFARRTVVAIGARNQSAKRVQKGAHLFASGTVEGKGVCTLVVVGFVRRVRVVGTHHSALNMGVVRSVLYQNAQRVHVGGTTSVLVTVGEGGANSKAVERVHKVALIFARPMVEVKDARGPKVSLVKVKYRAIYMLKERLGCVGSTTLGFTHALWFMTNGFVGVPHKDPWSRILALAIAYPLWRRLRRWTRILPILIGNDLRFHMIIFQFWNHERVECMDHKAGYQHFPC